jgi:beta-barrel assembly-enhancing protease
LLLIGLPAWSATSSEVPVLPDPGHTSMSKEKQEQLGLKTAAEVYKQMPVLPDSDPVTRYVQQLGGKLLGVIPRQETWPYQFHVVQQSDINAFALPGGPIFVNVGTISAAENEAELAGVLAHEMSHVYMQHSAKQAPKREWAGVLGALGGLLGGAAGDLAQMGIQFGAGTLLMKYSRHDEAQADEVGAIIMYKAGYDPRAMAEFFQKLEKVAGNGGPQFLSDHPNPGNRVEAEQISEGAKSGMWAQQNRQSGAVPRDVQSADTSPSEQNPPATITNVSYEQVAPSGEFKNFQGNDFSVSYPDNWKTTTGQNSATIAPAAGIGQNAIAYGVVVASVQDVDGNSINDATDKLIQNLQETNQNLRVFESPRKIAASGTEGLSTMLAGTSPIRDGDQAVPERDWLVTVPRQQGGMLYLVFIAPEKQFSQLQPAYQKMLDSLRVR